MLKRPSAMDDLPLQMTPEGINNNLLTLVGIHCNIGAIDLTTNV